MLDDHDVMAAFYLADEAGGLPLGVQGIQRDDHAGQVQALQARGQLGDLVRLRAHLPLGEGAALADVEGGQQVHPAAVRPGGAADGLAVRGGLRQQAGHGRPAGLRSGAALLPLMPGRLRQPVRGGPRHGGEVAVHRVVHRRLIRLDEDAAERSLARRPDHPGPRVGPPAQGSQHLLGAAGRPVCDGRRRVMPGGGERAHRQGQHELQRVPAAQRRARVRDLPQPGAQARAGRSLSGQSRGQAITGSVSQRR